MSEEQLFKCAAENTRRLFPPVVRSMNDIMREMFARDGMPQDCRYDDSRDSTGTDDVGDFQ